MGVIGFKELVIKLRMVNLLARKKKRISINKSKLRQIHVQCRKVEYSCSNTTYSYCTSYTELIFLLVGHKLGRYYKLLLKHQFFFLILIYLCWWFCFFLLTCTCMLNQVELDFTLLCPNVNMLILLTISIYFLL